jgi:hypothetical protein
MSCLLKESQAARSLWVWWESMHKSNTMRRVVFWKDDWKEQENEIMLSCNSCYTFVIIIIIIIIFFKEWYNILAKIKLKIWHEIRGVLWNKILKVTFISFFSLVQLIKLHFCIHEFHGKMAILKLAVFLITETFLIISKHYTCKLFCTLNCTHEL